MSGHIWPPRSNDTRIQALADPATPDDVFQTLRGLGYTGSLDDMWKAYKAAQGVTDTSEPFDGTGIGGASDPYFSYNVFMLPFTGAQDATVAADATSNANDATFVGTLCKIDQVQADPWGNNDGVLKLSQTTGNYVTIPNFQTSGDFTFEFWYKQAISNDSGMVWSLGSQYYHNGTQYRYAGVFVTTTGMTQAIEAPIEWHHYAVARTGTSHFCYKDGTYLTTLTSGTDLGVNTLNLGRYVTNNNLYWDGYISNIRLTNGVARYTGTGGFTPPTEAFPTS